MGIPRLELIAKLATLAALAAVSLVVVAGYFGSVHPAFDAVAHFRVHLAALLFAGAVAALFLRLRLAAACAMVVALGAILSVGPTIHIPGIKPVNAAYAPKDQSRPLYRLMQLNLRFNNPEPNKVLSLIGRTQPDVITLDEVSDMWREKIELIRAAYPYRVLCPSESWVGAAAVLSRRPFDGEGVCDDTDSFAKATVSFGGKAVDIVALHVDWPWPFAQFQRIEGLKPYLGSIGTTALAAGDLNAASWSYAARLIADSGSMKLMPGPGPTWLYRRLPAALRPWIGLPLDHVFAKGAIDIHSIATAGDVGSDHAPLIVEFSLAPPQPDPSGEPPTATAGIGPRNRSS